MAIQSVQIQSYFWSTLRITPYSVRMRENTDQEFGNFSLSYMIINVLDTMKKVPGNENEFN